MKNISRYLFGLLLAMMFFMIPAGKADAATTLTTLKTNKTYKTCDINNDGKKDSIRWKIIKTYDKCGYTEGKVYINGKYKFKVNGCKGVKVYLFRSGSKGILLSQFIFGDCGEELYKYEYSNKKYTSKVITNTGGFFISPCKSGNKLAVLSSPKSAGWYQSFSNYSEMPYFPFQAKMEYTLKKGKLVQATTYPTVIPKTAYDGTKGTTKLKAKYSFNTGTSIAKISSGNGPAVHAGTTVTFTGMVCKNYEMYFRIKVNGKTGWFKDSQYIQFRR